MRQMGVVLVTSLGLAVGLPACGQSSRCRGALVPGLSLVATPVSVEADGRAKIRLTALGLDQGCALLPASTEIEFRLYDQVPDNPADDPSRVGRFPGGSTVASVPMGSSGARLELVSSVAGTAMVGAKLLLDGEQMSAVPIAVTFTRPSPAFLSGCADGTREGFADQDRYPLIAGCEGAWSVPGIFDMPVRCDRQAGNDGLNPSGAGCSVSDLCAAGWHVCRGRGEVSSRSPDGCAGAMTGAPDPAFFLAQVSSTGAFLCDTGAGATNDLFGCGNLGCDFSSNPTAMERCAPLNITSHDLCSGLRNDGYCGDWCNHLGKYPELGNVWRCGNDSEKEALNVVKTGLGQGGVLCCRDE